MLFSQTIQSPGTFEPGPTLECHSGAAVCCVTACCGGSLSSCHLLVCGLLSNSPVGEELVSEQTGCGKTWDANRVVSALFRLLINSVAACKYLIPYVTA